MGCEMANKRSYRDLVIRLDEHMASVDNHLKNIDGHLNRLNERTGDCEVSVTKNSNNIKWIMRIGGGLFLLIPIVLKLMGVY